MLAVSPVPQQATGQAGLASGTTAVDGKQLPPEPPRQKPIEGVSMAYTFDQANAAAPSNRDTQYFEMVGNRAIDHDGGVADTTPAASPWAMGTGKMPRQVVSDSRKQD